MPRVSYTVARRKKKKRLFSKVKGFRGGRSKLYRTAKETLQRALSYAYRDRKVKKRSFKALWISRISAGTRSHGLAYSRFVNGLKKANVLIDKKMLAKIALNDPEAFEKLIEVSQKALNAR